MHQVSFIYNITST